jgi:cytochrome c oxidase subunit 2
MRSVSLISASVACVAFAGLFMSAASADELADLAAKGKTIFETTCKGCHGAEGAGFVGPALAGNDRLEKADFVIRQITRGGSDMPAMGQRLSADEIKAVASFIRNSWGNGFGPLPN